MTIYEEGGIRGHMKDASESNIRDLKNLLGSNHSHGRGNKSVRD